MNKITNETWIPWFLVVITMIILLSVIVKVKPPEYTMQLKNSAGETLITCSVKKLNQFLDKVTCPGFTHTVTHTE